MDYPVRRHFQWPQAMDHSNTLDPASEAPLLRLILPIRLLIKDTFLVLFLTPTYTRSNRIYWKGWNAFFIVIVSWKKKTVTFATAFLNPTSGWLGPDQNESLRKP